MLEKIRYFKSIRVRENLKKNSTNIKAVDSSING